MTVFLKKTKKWGLLLSPFRPSGTTSKKTFSRSVFWVLFALNYYYNSNSNPIAHKYLTHGTILELVWTITPSLILMAIAFPSFKLLYLMDLQQGQGPYINWF